MENYLEYNTYDFDFILFPTEPSLMPQLTPDCIHHLSSSNSSSTFGSPFNVIDLHQMHLYDYGFQFNDLFPMLNTNDSDIGALDLVDNRSLKKHLGINKSLDAISSKVAKQESIKAIVRKAKSSSLNFAKKSTKKIYDKLPEKTKDFVISHQGYQKLYCCPLSECSMAFDRKYNCQVHYKTHFFNKFFFCALCFKRFSRKNDRKRHNLKFHYK